MRRNSLVAVTASAAVVLAGGFDGEPRFATDSLALASTPEGPAVHVGSDLAVTAEQEAVPVVPVAVANDNRTPAGRLEDGVLMLDLELRMGRWFPDDDGGNGLTLPVFAEAGRAPQVPGPFLRVTPDVELRITVRNLLPTKATIFGFHTRPGHDSGGVELKPGASHDARFRAGAPGTYHYYAVADADARKLEDRLYFVGALAGGFVVDRPGGPVEDRIFVINKVTLEPNPIMDHEHEVLTINGKAWPYTERLTVTQGEPVRWRVLNPTTSTHPMHLHGAYFTVLGTGSSGGYTQYAAHERRTVVTELTAAGGTFDLLWTPLAPGGWLFHCHYVWHMSPRTAVPRVVWAPGSEHGTAPDSSAHIHRRERWDLGGLVLGIRVEPRPGVQPVTQAEVRPRHLQLVLRKRAAGEADPSTISSSIHEGAMEVAGAPGPPLVLTRGEAVELEVINELGEPTSIHWHGIELESYSDGVPGVGSESRNVTPPIAPGRSFVARMKPPRAGTFIYHSHWRHESQIADGLYGAIVVVEPGRGFDPRTEKILVIGNGENDWASPSVLLNGSRAPAPIDLKRGRTYRLRLINIAPNQDAAVSLLRGDEPLEWRAVAKDGWELPSHQRQMRASRQWISVGETYDFEFTARKAGDYLLEVRSHYFPDRRVTAIVTVR